MKDKLFLKRFEVSNYKGLKNQIILNFNMEKPNKDSEFVHSLEFTVSSTNSYFAPIVISITPGSEIYNEIVNRIKYIK